MTTNQTIDGVPRELLERLIDRLNKAQMFKESTELRALLGAERCTSCDGSGDLIDLTGEWRGYCVCPAGVALKNKPAEPMANPVLAYADSYRAMQRQGVEAVSIWSVITDLERNIAPLYAEQPAPVAVVLPGRREIGPNYPYLSDLDIEWNACLDELKRLNTSL